MRLPGPRPCRPWMASPGTVGRCNWCTWCTCPRPLGALRILQEGMRSCLVWLRRRIEASLAPRGSRRRGLAALALWDTEIRDSPAPCDTAPPGSRPALSPDRLFHFLFPSSTRSSLPLDSSSTSSTRPSRASPQRPTPTRLPAPCCSPCSSTSERPPGTDVHDSSYCSALSIHTRSTKQRKHRRTHRRTPPPPPLPSPLVLSPPFALPSSIPSHVHQPLLSSAPLRRPSLCCAQTLDPAPSSRFVHPAHSGGLLPTPSSLLDRSARAPALLRPNRPSHLLPFPRCTRGTTLLTWPVCLTPLILVTTACC